MSYHGWEINLSDDIPVYQMLNNGAVSNVEIGKILKNECFVHGGVIGAAWEGIDLPVWVLAPNHVMTMGVVTQYDSVDFADYASNSTSWEKVSTLERQVKYATVAYYADGEICCDLPAGSRVWLDPACTRGDENANYIAVSSVKTAAGKTYNFAGNGFIDLTYKGRWVNVNNILLRKV